MDGFQWAAGSVIGRAHQQVNKNNQDAFFVKVADGSLVGIVADGCGSAVHSEVGAWLGVELLAQAIAQHLPEPLTDGVLENIGQHILGQLPKVENFRRYYLFTLLGFVITLENTWIFGCGDGLFALNGEIRLSHFENNAPPYLIYPDENLKLFSSLKTKDLQSLLIATDGLEDWLAESDIATFWEDDKFFRNPDQVRRTLAIANKKQTLLRDDTTLISVRRSPSET